MKVDVYEMERKGVSEQANDVVNNSIERNWAEYVRRATALSKLRGTTIGDVICAVRKANTELDYLVQDDEIYRKYKHRVFMDETGKKQIVTGTEFNTDPLEGGDE